MKVSINKNVKNIPVINAYRAIGITLVCIAHFTYNIVGFFDHTPAVTTLHYMGYVGVMIFFTVSGFVIPWWLYHAQYRINDYLRFVARRMIRIEPPFLIALGLAVAYTFVRTMSPHYNGLDTTPTVKQVALHVGYLIPFTEPEIPWIRPAYWTLAIECQFYLLMGLLYPLLSHKSIGWRISAYAFIIGGSVYLILYTYGIFPWPYLFRFFPLLLAGTLLCLYITEKISLAEYGIVSVINAVIIWFFVGRYEIIALVFLPVMILYFHRYSTRFLNFIGNMSYSIYLMHSLTGTAVLNYLAHTVHNPALKVCAVIFGIAFTFFCSWVFYRLVEKPAHKISLKIAINEKEFANKKKKSLNESTAAD